MRLLAPVLLLALTLTACEDSDAPVQTRQFVKETDKPEVTTESGALGPGDQTLQETGEYYDRFEVVASEGQWIWTELISSEFDPYLILRPPTGEQIDVDDSQEGNTSLAKNIVQAGESGRWLIDVTTFAAGEQGAYELRYKVVDERPADADEGRQIQVAQ
ncbi:MAG: hypothetical protein AAFQ43_07710 [Bacteroidota bacterium]